MSSSIFMSDLCSFLHECVHESTRLNLNVNRELYYEIKQALELNEQSFLFVKWRLRSSARLLHQAYRNANANPANSLSLTLYSFLIKYSAYLLANLNRFHRVYSFLISPPSAATRLNIIHSEPYKRHLAWHLPLQHRHLLLGLLAENYFSLINDQPEQVILRGRGQVAYVKMVLAMCISSSEFNTTEQCWLLRKFFDSADMRTLLNHRFFHFDCLTLDELDARNHFGLKFCLKLFKANESAQEYELRRVNRDLYATNAVIFVLMAASNSSNQSLSSEYLCENQWRFASLVKAICCDDSVNPTIPKFMFISFLRNEAQTRQAVEHLLRNTFREPTQVDSVCCQLDSQSLDYVSNNANLIAIYQTFLKTVCKTSERPKLLDSVATNVDTLTAIFYSSAMRYLQDNDNDDNEIRMSTVIAEYNQRLRRMTHILSNQDFKRLPWPLPELISERGEKWTLMFWNTTECLDVVLQDQLYDLMCLDEIDHEEEERESDEEDDNEKYVKLEKLVKRVFDYLNRVLRSKFSKDVALLSTKFAISNISQNNKLSNKQLSINKLENLLSNNLFELKEG